MESNQLPRWKGSVSYWLKHVEEEEENNEPKREAVLPAIPQPEMPNEPMEFLSRSWSLSANEISIALATKHTQPVFHTDLTTIHERFTPPHLPKTVMKPVNERRRVGGVIGRLFHHKDMSRMDSNTLKTRDKARMENAHTHAVLSIAGLAAALASATSTKKSKSSDSKFGTALASATELLASYCIELAESYGADKDAVASVVKSAVGVQTASDLLTLTAAAATALRGEAIMNARVPKEAKRSASISPYEKAMAGSHTPASFRTEVEEEDLPCVGDLLQLTRKGVLRWKHVSVYINKAYQVTIKVKSGHVGGAFSKNNKCMVYDVIHDSSSWPFRKERENMELNFGVKTAQGLLEFKCKNKVDKQKWVLGIQNLLQRRRRIEEAENSLRMLHINTNI